jgi:N,N-dimethylformamidase
VLLTGYLNRLSYRPGDTIDVRMSTDADSVTLDLVRLHHGDVNPAGPGFLTDDVPAVTAQWIPGRLQAIHPGSYMRANDVLAGGPELELEVTVWPTTPNAGRVQGLLSLVDEAGQHVVALALDDTGTPVLTTPAGPAVRADRPLLERRWYQLTATVRPDECRLVVTALDPLPTDHKGVPHSGSGVSVDRASGVLVAALNAMAQSGRPVADGLYNGKVEAPSVGCDGVAARWAFEDLTDQVVAVDVSGHGHHGELVNGPARAMTGSNWTGEVDDVREVPEQYGAIHFHDDDLIDAGWEVDASITLPEDLASGVYAIRLRRVDAAPAELPSPDVDHIPFAVRPAAGAPRNSVAFLLPTFTYVAYANERLMHRLDYEAAGITDHPIVPGFHDRLLADHPEFGSSLYDQHGDGSGVCYSSYLRPVPNLRPDYRMWLQNAPRHLGADLYTVAFFDHAGIEYDVLTDHDVHAEGAAAFDGYQVVVTGSHPEYYSATMLDAVQTHVDAGGCLMYLGGNGFYWVTSADPRRPEVLEVRRSAGIRTWEAAPGEHHHSTTGEHGGLWRWRGRSPNKLVGVGMCSQGWDEKAPPFIRSELSYQPEFAWVFDGIEDRELGDFGLIMNGASGDELDRYDPALGSPPNTAVLATSGRHSNYYQLAVEDVLMLAPGLGGEDCDDVRSDMVLVEHNSGGAVFSVGSICFTGCLPCNGFDNNIARLVHNVLTNFHERNSKKS